MSKAIALYCPVSYFADDAVYIYLGNGMGSIISSNFQRIYFWKGDRLFIKSQRNSQIYIRNEFHMVKVVMDAMYAVIFWKMWGFN